MTLTQGIDLQKKRQVDVETSEPPNYGGSLATCFT